MAPERVAGDLYFDIDGQILEIKRQLRQKSGYPYDPMRLVEHLQAAISGNLVNRNGQPFAEFAFSNDMTKKEGWKLVEGLDEPDPEGLSSYNFEFVDSSRPYPVAREMFGADVWKRANGVQANFGQRLGEWLLLHPEKIPPPPSGCWVIPLPRTIWRDHVGNLRVPSLNRNSGQWRLDFIKIGSFWASNQWFLRPSKRVVPLGV